MTPKISLITAIVGAALVFAVPAAWGDRWFEDQQQVGVRVSPDLADRAIAARQSELAKMLDAREQAFGVRYEPIDVASVRVAPVRDDRFRIDYSDVPVPVLATSSGRELEWPQIGIGFGAGIILMLGLYLTVRYSRVRPLPH